MNKASIKRHIEMIEELQKRTLKKLDGAKSFSTHKAYEIKLWQIDLEAVNRLKQELIQRFEDASAEDSILIMKYLLGLKDD